MQRIFCALTSVGRKERTILSRSIVYRHFPFYFVHTEPGYLLFMAWEGFSITKREAAHIYAFISRACPPQVNEIAQIVTMEVSIRMFWHDPRLTLNNATAAFQPNEEYVTLNPRLARHLWIPDLFIDQAKVLREPTFHVLPASLRVYRRVKARKEFPSRLNKGESQLSRNEPRTCS